MNKKIQVLILVFIIILSISCKCQNKITLYWSGSIFTQNDRQNGWLFYLANYIEINDSGVVKIMIRKEFQSPMEFYIIEISDSVKNKILNLAMNPSMFSKINKKRISIYDGLTYSLRIKFDSKERKICYIPSQGNEIQKGFVKIMELILDNPSIKAKIVINLKGYEKTTEKDVLRSKRRLPQIMNDSIVFSPPKIRKK